MISFDLKNVLLKRNNAQHHGPIYHGLATPRYR